jgi:pimeloyl-ACP methyl ester carboxylesterase
MNDTATVPATAATLEVPGARLYYEVRGCGPLVVLVGAPMDARPLAALADLLAVDHTVLTTDPRGIFRSSVDDPDRDSLPRERADDLSRLISHLDAGPAVVFGSSGGAVSVLALAQTHPERVRTVIAHEPQLDEALPEREEMRAATEDIIATYLAGDTRSAHKKFMAKAGIHLPDEVFDMMFGDHRDPQEIADERFSFVRMLRGTTGFRPDVDAPRAAPVRVVVGVGEDSAGQFCDRTSRALAASLGIEPTMFPGGHIGFADDPQRFHARLREVLAQED